jgi:hypothetical protein
MDYSMLKQILQLARFQHPRSIALDGRYMKMPPFTPG